MYEKIAKFYDRLGWSMFPLKLWDQMKIYFKQENFNPSSHLDIACGTGVFPSNQVIIILREVGFSDITITDTNFNRLVNPDEEYRNVYICK